jgi:hypothetical protein
MLYISDTSGFILWSTNGPLVDQRNQIRVTGIPVCDYPYDRYRTIGIDTGEYHIPFKMDGNTLFFEPRVPTEEELENCPYIILTDDWEWDPTNVDLTDPRPKEIAMAKTGHKSTDQETMDIKLDHVDES